ncbi:response regulator transcription factor [Paramagnetospirillum magneticum]|uniref:FOG: CheY-like receiver n=1 Tax=Paramagnetospirillum magneticum (strain ATCC 700264 / AMB-1) TaxID=342108 RepID=Q2VZL9_PARM1|nr:response regulator transcription factor [Paramagnetospirillum magneticum]BAE52956.1 FOG: CheY-like receiver [Paramagnetospirillum magneticum AMB-1]
MSGRTVLLVDDSRVARMMTRSVVESACPDWVIWEASSGEEALDLALTTPPDFVLLDVNMPGMGGLEAARQFRARFPAVAVSLLTANIQDSIRDEASQLQIGYISKPLRDDLLIRFLTGGTPAP